MEHMIYVYAEIRYIETAFRQVYNVEVLLIINYPFLE